MLAGGWEGKGGGRIPFNFWCRREYNYPPPYFAFLYNSLHIINNCDRTEIIWHVFNKINFLNL